MQQAIEGFRLSPQQARLWSLSQQSKAYHAYCAISIEGSLDCTILNSAVETVMKRNEIYRTRFHRLPGIKMPIQVIDECAISSWQYIDLSNCPEQEPQKLQDTLMEGRWDLDLEQEQRASFHCALFTLSQQRHLLCIQLPALLADTQTLHNLVHDISRWYSVPDDMHTQHEEEMASYIQFSEWQHSLLEGENRALERERWSKKDVSSLSSLSLPFERSADPHAFRATALTRVLPPSLGVQIASCVPRQQLPAFLLTCWNILLWRLTHRDELLVGLAVDGRVYEELANTAGLFEKYMPLISHMKGTQRFCDLLAQVEKGIDELQAAQPYFFWEDLRDLSEKSSDALLYPFSFAFYEHPAVYKGEKIVFELKSFYSYYETFKICLVTVYESSRLRLEWQYAPVMFSERDIQRLSEQFTTLISSALQQPEARIDELNLLSVAERQHVLVEFNQTDAHFPLNLCVHHLFEQQVDRTPDVIAVEDEANQLTYSTLNARANQLAWYLTELGVGLETLVGIYLDRTAGLLISILGILKAGGAYVPLDPAYPHERLVSIAADARLDFLLTYSSFASMVPSIRQIISLDIDWKAITRLEGAEPPVNTIDPAHLAYVLYTSGSTGHPKGVMIPHQGMLHYIYWSSKHYDMAAGYGAPVHSSIAFDLTITGLFLPLVVGRRVIFVSEKQGIEGLGQLVRQGYDFSLIKLTPAHLDILNQLLQPEELSHVARALIIGGEALRSQSLAPWRENAPATRLINEYGPTEAVVGCCIYEVSNRDFVPGNVPVGRPIANARLYLLDSHMQPVPIGVAGELYIGGVGLGRGYLRRPDLTAEHFIAHPFSTEPGARLYRTGDVARYISSDGVLEFLGRTDRQVKLRGYRVELGEIETVLLNHVNVRECVIVLSMDTRGESCLIAYIVPEHLPAPAVIDLNAFLKEHLPSYMVPSFVVPLSALPLTANGKVDQQALPIPTLEYKYTESFVAPRTPVEELLVGIWQEVLQLPRIGIYDNFFDLGGHSLPATRCVARIQNTFRVEFSLQSFFDAPTIDLLAQQVEQAFHQRSSVASPSPLSVPVPIARDVELPLSFAQQRLWFLHQLTPDDTTYTIAYAFRMQGAFSVRAFEFALTEVVRRHEAFRTLFQVREGQPVQVILPATPFLLNQCDLSGLSTHERDAQVLLLQQQEAVQPFDLAHGSLLRVFLLRLSVQENILLLTLHHIIFDAWSGPILLNELTKAYNAFCCGVNSVLPELPVQYADFACWQRQWLQSQQAQVQRAYWMQQMHALPHLALPTDYPRPPVQTFHGALERLSLSMELRDDLKRVSQQEGTTLFMTLLAAFQVLLACYTGQKDIAVGTPIANRTSIEIEGLLGFFTNTLVMRTDLSSHVSLAEVLRRVRAVSLAAYMHQDLPFEQLVEVLQPERDLSRAPLFQVMFILQHESSPTDTFQGFSLEALPVVSTTAKFDLMLSIVESDHALLCGIEYNTDLFSAQTIRVMLERWQIVLEAFTHDLQQPFEEVSLMRDAECQYLLSEWNATEIQYPSDYCLHHLFEEQVDRTPDAVAVTLCDEQITYEVLNQQANSLAHYLCQQGVGPDVAVGICMERSLKMVISVLGILKAAGAYVPLDPTYPPERLVYMLVHAQVQLLLIQGSVIIPALYEHCANIVDSDHDWECILQERAVHNPDVKMADMSLAYIIYTSGSTGMPKGIAMPHRALVNLMRWQHERSLLTSGARTLQFTSLSFDVACQELFSTWCEGGNLVLIEQEMRYDPNRLNVFLNEVMIERLFQPFVAFQQLVLAADVQGNWPLSLKEVITAGEQPQMNTLLRAYFAHTEAVFTNQYGPAESHVVTSFMLDDSVARWPVLPPIGTPIANTQIYVLDERLQPVAVGLIGEIYIGGRGVARGYIQRPDLTAERFLPHPFSKRSGERLYRTGDLGRHRYDGVVEFLGRVDQQIKIRGYRVEPGEIEAALSEHPEIREAAVLAPEREAGDRHLIAYIVSEESEHGLSEGEIRTYLRQKLPDYMLPTTFVRLEAMPLTATGKVKRDALPALPGQLLEHTTDYIPPQTEMERLITAIWQDVLGAEQISSGENFFDLGGHSLLAIQVQYKLQQALQREVALITLFQYSTVYSLAQALSQQREERLEVGAIEQRTEVRKGTMKRQLQQRKAHRAAKF